MSLKLITIILILSLSQSCAGAKTGFKLGAIYIDKKTGNIYEVNGEFYIEKRNGDLQKIEEKPKNNLKKQIEILKNKDGTYTINGKKYKKQNGKYVLIDDKKNNPVKKKK